MKIPDRIWALYVVSSRFDRRLIRLIAWLERKMHA